MTDTLRPVAAPALPAALSAHFDPHTCKATAQQAGGFVTAAQLAWLAVHPTSRLWLMLVRCHGGRFMTPAQDVAHFIACAEAGGDGVRDVSFPAETRG
jgi:hypothetical protein